MTKDPKLSFMIGSHYIQEIELHVVEKGGNWETAVRHALADIIQILPCSD